jgi:hypothetical protein
LKNIASKQRDGSKEKRGAQKRNEQYRQYAFAGTLLIIAIIVGASVISSQTRVEHIPDNFRINNQPWMKYAPNPVEYLTYVNFDAALGFSKRPQLFGSEPLAQFYQLNYSIFPRDATFEVDMQLPLPQYGGTVTIIMLHNETRNILEARLTGATTASPYEYQGFTVHGLLMKKAGDQKLLQGFLSLVGNYAILSNDQSKGREEVEHVLDRFAFSGPGLFDDPVVMRGVYATGDSDKEYIGLYIGVFQTQLNDSKMIVKTVVQDGSGILVTRSILFPTSDVALSRIGDARRIYRDASSYRVMDSWLVVAYKYPVERLRPELAGA